MYQAAKEKQTSKILLPLLSTWKKGTNHKWGGKGVTRQNGSYETKTKTIINNKYDHRYRNKTNLEEGNQPQMGRQRFQF